jgi:hypothetical protein
MWQKDVTLNSTPRLMNALRLVVGLLILKVTFFVVAGYPDYLPPDFTTEFLRGRMAYFFGSYQWAFYPHIAAGPCTLVLGMVLLSHRFRRRFPRWHARLGRLQVACVLLVVAPSGLWMAFHAHAGAAVKAGFAILAVFTGACAWLGLRSAVGRQFSQHAVWMQRCYVLLCSAVVTRLIGGGFLVAGVDGEWTYLVAAWLSWLVPLGVFEVVQQGTLKAVRPVTRMRTEDAAQDRASVV